MIFCLYSVIVLMKIINGLIQRKTIVLITINGTCCLFARCTARDVIQFF